MRRNLTSCDVSNQRQYVFRDETTTARVLSERARGTSSNTGRAPLAATDVAERSIRPSSQIGDAADLQPYFPWLNERAIAQIPEPLKRNIETRAIERFFVDWTMHPSSVSPGHMHHLPMLYESAPAGTVLPLVVQAVAFADTRNTYDSDDVPFAVKAQRSYGAALARMRTIADNEENFASDRVLAALLLFDCYEVVYLAKSDLLGSHNDAIQYVMHSRGLDQLYHHPQFCLWRVANWQLQARQVLSGEEPTDLQKELVSKLNLNRPELHISADVLQISALCAASKQLFTDIVNSINPASVENIDRATYMLQSMTELFDGIDAWTSLARGPWRPVGLNTDQEIRSSEGSDLSSDLYYQCPLTFSYSDASMACIWNFHSACQIVLREWFIRLAPVSSRSTDRQGTSSGAIDDINHQKEAIERLSGSIIRSVPLLMGFADIAYTSERSPAQSYEGTMVAR